MKTKRSFLSFENPFFVDGQLDRRGRKYDNSANMTTQKNVHIKVDMIHRMEKTSHFLVSSMVRINHDCVLLFMCC